MRTRSITFVAALALTIFAVAGCAQAVPTPAAPTQAAPAKTAPTQAAPTQSVAGAQATPGGAMATAAPTQASPSPAAPAQATPTQAMATQAVPSPAAAAPAGVYPQAGRSITAIVPFSAGGSSDISARTVGAALEAELGVPVQIVNRPGGATQVGMSELVGSSPDGYTIAFTSLPSFINAYLDPESDATYGRDDFELVARTTVDPIALSVRADSPYQTLADLIEAARANPEGISLGLGGILGVNHLNVLLLEEAAGVKFNGVQFQGGAPVLTALLGGHVDAGTNASSELLSNVQSGTLRILGLFDTQESSFYPGVPTVESQGYDAAIVSSHVVAVPAGTPPEVKQVLEEAIGRVLQEEAILARYRELGLQVRYLNQAEVTALWESVDADSQPIIEEFRQR